MVWIPDSEKKIDAMFIRFDRIHERDRHTHRQTPHDDMGRACGASDGKNYNAVATRTPKKFEVRGARARNDQLWGQEVKDQSHARSR